MTSAIGWYGPLIDLSKAALHIGDFVQLVVFIHRITPLQYKLSNGGEVIRTDIQVGDETRPFFSVSLWQKQMGSMAVYGDVVLLQNVKIVKYRDVVEAKTVTQSSLHRLLHPYESILTKGVDELIEGCRVGIAAKEKLRKVVEWVKKSNTRQFRGSQLQQRQFPRNWKLPEESKKPEDCCSVSRLSHLTNSCKAVFDASVAEIFMPQAECESWCDKEDMFVSRRLCKKGDPGLVRHLICTGCRICGSPLEANSENTSKQNAAALYCLESSNRLHVISLIYRPFMLYVWDDSDYAPLLVKNKAAELLFGNIKAERVYSCYKEKPHDGEVNFKDTDTETGASAKPTSQPKAAEGGVLVSCSSAVDKRSLEWEGKLGFQRTMDFYRIWLILLKTMLQQRTNSLLKFVVNVNASLDWENGRFEMVSVQMPCLRTKRSPEHI
ncbi:putative nucleic acid-binding protein [Rosa chinensis]|uniref:Putative nucleic acid-binding protein n=1 Tax=Rosa chinensis TaxID=74649 RepID=A0A2P6PX43_ROSCH|nr:uncharacterized protein LOC112174674 [Rosa chinensis]XP_040364656.1 uncharacterized protein LOC112174674 [Rosa chinensis]XP_040364657.1 uncharacterized protein LOC112174674 [Rosa chinensis]XP_040364658.1 uncharacterized protein LOC112174674 [Rosa chinensis]XP_040364659.1 uncharacterized protein LOC112174674 [Rosa chinensis]XP_040364660.1 uncharacterized protein LOC112174674 [Rosa chinensis]XP_040364661.1 uncharacterized protein LOC112174674 [Rosa chinensis]PRQ26501.1 putative nucleic acid